MPRDPAMVARSPEEQRFQDQLKNWIKEETGYSQIMGTKPQTLAYALTDSPAGLAAWLLERIGECESFDFIAEFAGPLPALVIMDMLGAPRAELEPQRRRARGNGLSPRRSLTTRR